MFYRLLVPASFSNCNRSPLFTSHCSPFFLQIFFPGVLWSSCSSRG